MASPSPTPNRHVVRLLEDLLGRACSGEIQEITTMGRLADGQTLMAASSGQQIDHASDCAVHNGPAYEQGPCTCGIGPWHPADAVAPGWRDAVQVVRLWRHEILAKSVEALAAEIERQHMPAGGAP